MTCRIYDSELQRTKNLTQFILVSSSLHILLPVIAAHDLRETIRICLLGNQTGVTETWMEVLWTLVITQRKLYQHKSIRNFVFSRLSESENLTAASVPMVEIKDRVAGVKNYKAELRLSVKMKITHELTRVDYHGCR